MKRRLDPEPPVFTEREQALLTAWDERNAPPADGAFHDQLLAAYHRAEEASLRPGEAADETICVQMASDAALVDALNDLGGPDESPTRAVPVDVAAVVRRAGTTDPSHLHASARRGVLVATAIAAAAVAVAASLGPQYEVPAPAPLRSASAVDDTHGAAAGATIRNGLPPLEVNPAVAAPAGGGFTSATIGLGVSSTPPGADVLLDGRMIGRTPLVEIVPRAAGAATLKFRLARYQDFTATVDLGADSNVDVKLEPLPPQDRVTTLPPPRPCNGETTNPPCKVVNDVNEPASRVSDLVAKAVAKSHAGDHAGAIELYNRATPESDPILLTNIASEYEQSGDMAKALRYYCRYLARDPVGASARYATARARQLHARLRSEGGNESERWEDICAADAADEPRDSAGGGGGGGGGWGGGECKGHRTCDWDPPK